jgi:hypothetical protein
MIGYRGCYRYIREPELFALELELLARVREQSPNLHVMIPFVRTAWELEACLEAIDASPLGRQRGLLRWVMAEVPSVVYRIPEYAAMGIDGVSIGSNDLTQLMLGVDRDSEVCAELFDESDAAVLDAIERIIRRLHTTRGSPRRSAARRRRTAPSSPSTWSGGASTRSRSTPTRWTMRAAWWGERNAGSCSAQPGPVVLRAEPRAFSRLPRAPIGACRGPWPAASPGRRGRASARGRTPRRLDGPAPLRR